MKIFAIGDLHLSFGEGVSKPMDKFGGQWVGHTEKLHRNWTENIGPEDVVCFQGIPTETFPLCISITFLRAQRTMILCRSIIIRRPWS